MIQFSMTADGAAETRGEMVELISRVRKRLLDNAPADFKACLAAGVQMETDMVQGADGNYVLTMRTANPVGVVWIDGKATVYERRPDSILQ